jgi:RNA polymerase sigma-70 factor, ECF subfamily
LVYGVCMKYLGNKSDARKAVQAIFEKVTVEIIKDEPLHFRNWLFQITMVYCTKQQNTNKNNQIDVTDTIHPLDDNLFRPDLLRDCVKQLLPDERTVIDQFYKQNKSYRQIAERLDKTEEEIAYFIDTAKVQISNYLNKSSQKNSDVE